jgi:hypothetical protein
MEVWSELKILANIMKSDSPATIGLFSIVMDSFTEVDPSAAKY